MKRGVKTKPRPRAGSLGLAEAIFERPLKMKPPEAILGHPPTAEEVSYCPPHHWLLDRDNVGRCQKCPAVKDFEEPQRNPYRSGTDKQKSSKGGSRSKKTLKKSLKRA